MTKAKKIPFPLRPVEPMSDLDKALPTGTTFRDEDLAAWWCAALEKLYKVAKRRAKAQAHFQKVSTYDRDGVEQFSLALGKVQMLESLCPEFFNAWISDDDPRRKQDPENWSQARLVVEAAEQDAKEELRSEVLLMALATGEVAAPSEEREKAA